MKNSIASQVVISEISTSDSRSITFSCDISSAAELSFILQDEKGRSFCHKRLPVACGSNELEISLPRLSAGSYNAWIGVADQTVIRKVIIEPRAEQGGYFSKFKKWLNFL